jgi:tryptophan halogenase
MTGNARAPLRSVVVVGGGLVARAAALGFARALPGARVTLVSAAVPDDAFADRLPLVLPCAHGMLTRLGLDPELMVARGIAMRRPASRFTDWSRDRAPWLVSDDLAAPVGPVALHHLWLRACLGKRTVPPFHALLPGCVAALAGRADPHADAALHLDPSAVGNALAAMARQSGVALAAPLRGVHRAAGHVAAVVLEDGTRHEADLFVDASGAARRLIAEDAAFEPWHDTLPCDRLTLAPDPHPAAFVGDDYRATANGWSARWRGLLAQGTSSEHGTTAGIAFAPGRLAHPFAGNVLALGEAAAQPGPLGLTGLTLALAQLELALELLPCRGDEPLLRAEYNRRAGLRADRLRDFLGAQYHGGGRRRGAFWSALTDRPRPPALERVLVQFRQRGHLASADETSVGRDAWAAVLLGQGLRPHRGDPIAAALSPDDAANVIFRRARDIADRHSDRIAPRL